MDIETKSKETKKRNNEQVKPQDRTDYECPETDIKLCNKSQKFVTMPERPNLNKITEFLKFSCKLRLAVYFDRWGRSNKVSYEGEGPWKVK